MCPQNAGKPHVLTVMFDSDGKILSIKRPARPPSHIHPGGHVDLGPVEDRERVMREDCPGFIGGYL